MTQPLERKEELISHFLSGAKPREQWRIGTEYEKVAVSKDDARALPFSGPRGVEELLRRLIDRYGYEPDDEHGRIIALKGERAPITIEPGGQIELSGEQCETIHCAHNEFSRHIEQLIEIGHELDAAILGLGMQPVSRINEIELLPKERYRIMYPYMARKGRLGQRMMKQTAGVQANLDYSDEADAMRKLRVSMGIVPIVYAIFANSPLSDGGLNGYQSYRGHIWTDTDPDRCGTLEFVFRDDAGFADYVEYALDVPMYFLERDHRYINLTTRRVSPSASSWSAATARNAPPSTIGPTHLTTIFTEVRLKKYIEMRTADSQPPALMLALPALCKGILYDSDCMTGAWDLVKRWSFARAVGHHRRVAQDRTRRARGTDQASGTRTRTAQYRDDWAHAPACVKRTRRGREHLPLRMLDQVRMGHSQASLTIERWKGRWNYDVQRLVEGCSYEAEATI